MSLGGSLKSALAGVALVVAGGVTDVAAQQPEEKEASYDEILRSVDNIEAMQLEIERLKFYNDNGYAQEVRKNVRVNFASHFPSGEAITQSMYEVGASLARKPTAPQVVILVVRDPNEALTLRSGNRFSNTEYEQKIVDMARNVSNSFEDPQAKVLLMLAVAQEDKINTNPGDILFYINDRVSHFSPSSEDYNGQTEEQFIRDVALSLGHQFSTGHYKLSQAQMPDTLDVGDEGRVSRNDVEGNSLPAGDSGDTGEVGGSGDQTVNPPILADNSI